MCSCRIASRAHGQLDRAAALQIRHRPAPRRTAHLDRTTMRPPGEIENGQMQGMPNMLLSCKTRNRLLAKKREYHSWKRRSSYQPLHPYSRNQVVERSSGSGCESSRLLRASSGLSSREASVSEGENVPSGESSSDLSACGIRRRVLLARKVGACPILRHAGSVVMAYSMIADRGRAERW